MNKITKLLALAGLAFGFATCASADVVWTLDASFTYNALTNHATGTFQLDPSFNLVTWDLTVNGTNVVANNEYTPGDSFRANPMDSTHFDFYDPGTNQYLNLFLQSPGVTNGGGVVNLLHGNGGQNADATLVCPGCGTLSSGTVTGAPLGTVPEPRLGAFLVIGLAGIGLFARRKLAPARS